MYEFFFYIVYLFFTGMDDHMTGTPGLYTSGRSTSSSSSPGGGPVGSSPALLVVPQPINATKMAGVQNGGPQPRKYQCKMCPQVSQFYVCNFFYNLSLLGWPDFETFVREQSLLLTLLVFTLQGFRHIYGTIEWNLGYFRDNSQSEIVPHNPGGLVTLIIIQHALITLIFYFFLLYSQKKMKINNKWV